MGLSQVDSSLSELNKNVIVILGKFSGNYP